MNVTVLMADRCSSTSVSVALEFFECANVLHQYSNRKFAVNSTTPLPIPFQVASASVDGRSVSCTGGLTLTPETSLAQIANPDLVIVPGFMFNVLAVLPKQGTLIDWLRECHAHGTYIASMCTGSFLSAQAGLLDGRFATTHWAFADQFRRRFPSVKLQTERTVTDDGLVMCSGGSTTGTDLLLHMIRKFSSPQLASECAKNLLVDNATRSQLPYSSTTFKKGHNDAKILEVQIWMEKNLSRNIQMEHVIDHFGFGMRNFIRRFKDATEQSPIQYLQSLRIERAKHLLESSKTSFEQITLHVGYEDVNSFRRLFKEKVGLTPTLYRKRFETSRI
ncbi:MAG: helix-turn-helix domain-containing protein [Pseudomonadales bacterium]|uniref:Transcriptional regulator n=1 Tax=Oleiphilus messinensis TaxID=141451 RepID=A0A1Y0I7I1_9GAMM|nr:helix-turn-helix domain-containing protein [Oleiphilus messinensis]ARU55394.1 transcriptional regulator [Oleiphilus messinensis]MCG8610302.1 helix-turn-helix domain-containing protein [Pseudomonadales bacterium]